MKIHQFYDEDLAQAGYAVVSGGEMAVIDPARNPGPYYQYAREEEAKIVAVIETHSHADFISSHLEIQQKTGATIYASAELGAQYPHKSFDSGEEIKIGQLRLKALNTPGHSADSICVLLIDKDGREHSIFTGDTLFVGDVGRPDLRETGQGGGEEEREQLARKLYRSTREKLMPLSPEIMLYPGHGAGSLCGKNLSSETTSTIGRELKQNPSLQEMDEDTFVTRLLHDQPYIPKYFKYSVEINRQGAAEYHKSLLGVPRLTSDEPLEEGVLVVDARDQLAFKGTHLPGSLNLMDGPKFETWLGSLLAPDEPFYLMDDEEEGLDRLIEKAAKIGYEGNIRGAVLAKNPGKEHNRFINLEHFRANPNGYTIVDVRNTPEVQEGKLFPDAMHIPLHELRERANEVPQEKPVVVHCAAGYRSAAAFSILKSRLKKQEVYDLGEAVKTFMK